MPQSNLVWRTTWTRDFSLLETISLIGSNGCEAIFKLRICILDCYSHILTHRRITGHEKVALYHSPEHAGATGRITFEHENTYYVLGCTGKKAHKKELEHGEEESSKGPRFCALRPDTWVAFRNDCTVVPLVDLRHPLMKCFSVKLVKVWTP